MVPIVCFGVHAERSHGASAEDLAAGNVVLVAPDRSELACGGCRFRDRGALCRRALAELGRDLLLLA
jgi:hypothetical protein